MQLNRKNRKMSFNGRTLARNEQMERFVYENILGPGGCLPLARGYIHVHAKNIQTSSSLKPLGQSKPNFTWIIKIKLRSSKSNEHINEKPFYYILQFFPYNREVEKMNL